jgi:hypothetical protein
VVLNVGRGLELPAYWHGARVVDGDAHDNRWLDPRGVIVGLRVKDGSGRGLSTQAVGIRTFVKPAA